MPNYRHALAAAALTLSMLMPGARPVYAEDSAPNASPSPTAQITESAPEESAAPDALIIEESAPEELAPAAPVPTESAEPTESAQPEPCASASAEALYAPDTSTPAPNAEATSAPAESAHTESAPVATAPTETDAPDASAESVDLLEISAPAIVRISALDTGNSNAGVSAAEATIEKGDTFNAAIKSLVSGGAVTKSYARDTTVAAFRNSDTAPDASVNAIDISEVQDGSVLAWFDSATGTVFWYSDADIIYTNADSRSMFSGFKSAKILEIESLNTSRAEIMSGMFMDCEALETVNMANFSTVNVVDMSFMFSGCKSLTELDVSGFDTSKVRTMWWMFDGCQSIKKLDLSSFDTSALDAGFAGMFINCTSLEYVDISSFDFSAISSGSGQFGIAQLFTNDTSLNTLVLGEKCFFHVVESGTYSMFSWGAPTATKTASGLPSNGKWGKGSETAPWALASFARLEKAMFQKNQDNISETAIAGAWYAQAESGAIFDANGGEGEMSGQPYVSDDDTLNLNTFTRTGYRFLRWNTAPDSSGTSYEDGAKVSLKTPITLYAQWAPVTYDRATVEVLNTGGAGWPSTIANAGAGIAALAVVWIIWYRRAHRE